VSAPSVGPRRDDPPDSQTERQDLAQAREQARAQVRHQEPQPADPRDHRGDTRPDVGRIWRPKAFVGFGDEADYAQIQIVLARTARPRASVVTFTERVHALPEVRCAFPISTAAADADHAAGGTACGDAAGARDAMPSFVPCGQLMHAVYKRADRWHYRSSVCADARHNTMVPSLIEGPVLAAVAARFTAPALAAALDHAWLVSAAERQRLPTLRRHAEQSESYARMALEMAITHAADGDADAASHAQASAARYRRDAREARERLAAFAADASRIGALLDDDAARVVALATDLPALFARAASHSGVVRRLVSSLLTAVHIRRRSVGLLDVGIEYPTGAVEWLQVTTMTVRAHQPERVYALGRLSEGADAATVSSELNALRGEEKFRTGWTPERVTGLALQWKDRDPNEDALTKRGRQRMRPGSPGHYDAVAAGRPFGPNKGRYAGESVDRLAPVLEAGVSVAALAKAVGASHATVWQRVLRGKLGRAVFREGTLYLAGASSHVDRQFPEYARRRVATDAGWPLKDVALVAHLAAKLGHDTDYVERRANAASGMRTDACNRKYARRSDVEPPPRRITEA
jgi:hypothetical protein